MDSQVCPVPGCQDSNGNGSCINEQKTSKVQEVPNSNLLLSIGNLTTAEIKPELVCTVCGDKASGKHYGVLSCDGCRGFFKRSIRRNLAYVCKENGTCIVDVTRRNQCQACRFQKCIKVNMKRDAVQHERAPRNYQSKRYGSTEPITRPWIDSVYTDVPSLFPVKIPCNTNATIVPPRNVQEDMSQDRTCTRKRDHHCSEHHGHDNIRSIDNKYMREKDQHDDMTQPSTIRFHQPFIIHPFVEHFAPPMFSVTSSPENVHENAARLLFLAVKWARSIPAFLQLPFRDQAILLEEAWAELFILNAAQWTLDIDDACIITGETATPSEQRHSNLISEARTLREIINRFTLLHTDQTEYACLKALILFKPEARGLRECLLVEVLQDQTHLMLQEYTQNKQPVTKVRYGKLLLLLPPVRSITSAAIEAMFFRKTIGSIPIERLLCDMFKSS